MKPSEFSRDTELIYWIDEWFVQETAQQRIGRKLNNDEMRVFTKYLEWGLWDSVYEVTKIAIDLTTEEEN